MHPFKEFIERFLSTKRGLTVRQRIDNVSCPERNADCRCYDGGRHSVEFERVSFNFMPLTSDAINDVNGKVEGACPQYALFCKQ